MSIIFQDRMEAGQLLAARLDDYKDQPHVVILALPRGGVPVAFEISKVLHVPMDVILARKLGTPGYEELALGAIASGGITVINKKIVHRLRIGKEIIDRIIRDQKQEIERRETLYRGLSEPLNVTGRTVILVDDGIATGCTLFAALEALKHQKPRRIVVAVPVAPVSVCGELAAVADELVVVTAPGDFYAVGQAYENFKPVDDSEVVRLMKRRNSIQTSSPLISSSDRK